MYETNINKIKKYCKDNDITFKKENITLNGNDAYRVDGKLYTKYKLIEAYNLGDIYKR